MTNAAIGALLAAVVAVAAYRARALTLGGAIAAFVVGGVVFGAGGWGGALVLLAFFIPSTPALATRPRHAKARPRPAKNLDRATRGRCSPTAASLRFARS